MTIENLSELRVLVACARLGSLSAAARHLGMTPAAASAALKKLEGRLGVRLIERTTRAQRLTAAGDILLAHAQATLDRLDEAMAELSEQRQALRGLIRVSGPSDLTRRVLLPFMDEFLATHPAVSLRLSVSDRLQDLLRDDVDMALRYGDLPDSQLIAKPLVTTCRIACAAPSYLARRPAPMSPADLVHHECITFRMRHQHERQWRFWRIDAPAQAPLEIRIGGSRQCDDGEIAHRWALAGHGIVYKSALDVSASLRAGNLVRLFPHHRGEQLPLNAVLPSQRFLPERVRALAEFLAERVKSIQNPV